MTRLRLVPHGHVEGMELERRAATLRRFNEIY
jgi:hypothetical protein